MQNVKIERLIARESEGEREKQSGSRRLSGDQIVLVRGRRREDKTRKNMPQRCGRKTNEDKEKLVKKSGRKREVERVIGD